MLAGRNRYFRIAALLLAGSYLFIAAKSLIEVIHLLGHEPRGAAEAALLLNLAGRLVGAVGWGIVGAAFDREVDWRRLRIGIAMVVGGYVALYAATVCAVTAISGAPSDVHAYILWSSIAVFLTLGALLVVGAGLGDSSRGSRRSLLLQVGLGIATAGAVADTVTGLYVQSYWSSQSYVHELTIGMLVVAIGLAGNAGAAFVFTFGARWSLRLREARLAAAAAGAAVASLVMFGGKVTIAIGFSTHGAPVWYASLFWLDAAYGLGAIAIGTCIALGARSVARAP
jgi:hypothetical protein